MDGTFFSVLWDCKFATPRLQDCKVAIQQCWGKGAIVNSSSQMQQFVNYCCCSVAKPRLTFLELHRLQPARLLCPWGFPGKNIGEGCHFLLQGIFPTQGLNTHLLLWQADSSPQSHQGRSCKLFNVIYSNVTYMYLALHILIVKIYNFYIFWAIF